MPFYCAFGCDHKDSKGTTMHVFPNPVKCPDNFKKWVKLVEGLEDEGLSDYEIFKKKRICDIHFINEHRNRFKRLRFGAVPTLHLSGNSRAEQSKVCDDDSDEPNEYPTAEDTDDDPDDPTSIEDVTVTDKADAVSSNLSNMFSWQNVNVNEDSVINIDEIESQKQGVFWLPEKNVFTYSTDDKDDPLIKEEINSDDPEEFNPNYKCSNCSNDILNHRYTCVECVQYDMCGACEAAHDAHYVLRVPNGKHTSESLRVLNVIRKELDICTRLLDRCNQMLEENITKIELEAEGIDELSGRVSPALSLGMLETQYSPNQTTKRKPDIIEAQDTGQKKRKLDSSNNTFKSTVIQLDNETVAETISTTKENNISTKLDPSSNKNKPKLLLKPLHTLTKTGKIIIPRSSIIKPLKVVLPKLNILKFGVVKSIGQNLATTAGIVDTKSILNHKNYVKLKVPNKLAKIVQKGNDPKLQKMVVLKDPVATAVAVPALESGNMLK